MYAYMHIFNQAVNDSFICSHGKSAHNVVLNTSRITVPLAEQTVELPVIEDAMTPMWRHSNDIW